MGLNIAMLSSWAVRCGIATYSCNLVNALAKQDANVYVCRLPRFGLKDLSLFQNVIDRIPVDKVDLIHVQHEYGLYGAMGKTFFPALKKLGKPIVVTMHAVGKWDEDAVIAEVGDKFIVHNEFCYGRFEAEKDKVSIIPHGMSPLQTPLPPKEICKKRLGIQPEVPIVGYVGYISEYKGLGGLIDAMVDVPNTGLLIGGGWFVEQETDYIFKLKQYSLDKLPNRCQWVGYVPEEDLAMTYGAMDIVVYPSRYMTESGALLMAVSHGKAVVASDLPPVREKAKKGALTTFKDIPDLVEKIRLLLSNSDLRKQYEENAAKFTMENSWEEVAKQHMALYDSMVTRTSSKSTDIAAAP